MAAKYLFSIMFLNFILLGYANAENLVSKVNFVVIASGFNATNGAEVNRKIEIFTSQKALNSSLAIFTILKKEHTIDFNSKQSVLLSMGTRSSGGYSIKTETIEDHGNYIKLKVLLTKPGNNCMVSQMLTSPYQFIEIESDKELVVEERVVVDDCN